jgi:DNA-binding protein H-NS
MIQDALRDLHRSGRLIEVTFDTPRDEPSVLESGVPSRRAPRTPGGLSARDRKCRQRQRDKWRAEVFELTDDEKLVESVCDRPSYLHALRAAARQEKRREDDTVEYRVRLCYDNGEGSSWAGTGVTGPREIVECFESEQRRGNGARPRTRSKARLQENRAAFTEVYRLTDDEAREMFSRILARDETSGALITSSPGD